MNERVKKAYQSGAFEPFMEVIREVMAQNVEVQFEPNPYKNAYNMGKSDMAKALIGEIENQIAFHCK